MYELENIVFPEPYIILYEQLKPFSLGHLFLLNRIGIKTSKDFFENKNNIFLAIYICSRNSDEVWADLQNGNYIAWLRKKQRFFKKKKFDLQEEIEIFFDYIKICSETISYWRKSSDGTSAPEKQGDLLNYFFIFSYALNELHLRLKEILNMPLGFLVSICIVDLARKGIVEIKTSEDESLIEFAKNYKPEGSEQ